MKKIILTLAAAALVGLGSLGAAAETATACPNPNCPYDGAYPYVQEGGCPNQGQRPQDGTGLRRGAGKNCGMGRGLKNGSGVCRRG